MDFLVLIPCCFGFFLYINFLLCPFLLQLTQYLKIPLYLKRILVLDDENINVCHWYVKQVLRAFDDQPSKHLSSLVRLFGSLPWVSCKHSLLVGSCGGFLCSLLLAASPAAPDVSGAGLWALRGRVTRSCGDECVGAAAPDSATLCQPRLYLPGSSYRIVKYRCPPVGIPVLLLLGWRGWHCPVCLEVLWLRFWAGCWESLTMLAVVLFCCGFFHF